MKKTSKINFKKAAAYVSERLEKVFNAKTTDVWQRGVAGAIVTLRLPQFCNSMDAASEASLCIAIAKHQGIINDGRVTGEDNEIIVKLF